LYFYIACGLGISSEIALPELVSCDAGADITIRLGKAGYLPLPEQESPDQSWVEFGDTIGLYWQGVGVCLIRAGREIIVEPETAIDGRLRLMLLGPALGALLQQRGLLALHASAVAFEQGAVAFIGDKGWGKSTMAAALHVRGHELVADDMLAIDLNQKQPLALPAFPQLKLWPDSLAMLNYPAAQLPRLYPDFDKRGLRLTTCFSSRPRPLVCIYILGQMAVPAIKRLPGSQSLLKLIPHWYATRFSQEVLDTFGVSTPFMECADLIRRLPVFELTRPDSLEKVPEVAQMVEEHLGQGDGPRLV
jgi:hypothetical protein